MDIQKIIEKSNVDFGTRNNQLTNQSVLLFCVAKIAKLGTCVLYLCRPNHEMAPLTYRAY